MLGIIPFNDLSPQGPGKLDAGTSYGKIFVDSPEIYTRERLVNDRFRQDAWLRGVLSRMSRLDDLGPQVVLSESYNEVRELRADLKLDGNGNGNKSPENGNESGEPKTGANSAPALPS